MPLSETGRKYPSLLEQTAKALPGSCTLTVYKINMQP
jgi:hypothetical protein